jgi:transposase-like protein
MCRSCLHENSDWLCDECGEHFTNEEHEEGSYLCPSCRFSYETEFYNENCYE